MKRFQCKINERRQQFDLIFFFYLKMITESIWKAPKEGYMTIEEYNRLNLVHTARTEQQMHEESKYMRENADEIASKYRREQLKAIRARDIQREVKEKEIEREGYTSCNEEEEETAAPALGKWHTVVRKYIKLCHDFVLIQFFNDVFCFFQRSETDRFAVTNIS